MIAIGIDKFFYCDNSAISMGNRMGPSKIKD